MKSVSFATVLLVVTVSFLSACGKASSEAVRTYAEACIKFKGGGERVSARCNCEASIIAPRFTERELKAYVATLDTGGKVYTPEEFSKYGVTQEDVQGMDKKMMGAIREEIQTCGEW